METPKVPKSFIKMLKLVRPGLNVAWNRYLERFMIAHIHEHTKQTRVVMIVDDEEGEFRMPDHRDIIKVQTEVDWDLIDRYPNPNDMYNHYMKAKADRVEKNWKKRRSFIRDFIRDDQKRWDAAIERMRQGDVGQHEAPKDKPISIDMGKNKSLSGYKVSNGGIIIKNK